MEYLHGSMDLFLTLRADNITFMKTWVDASYAIHQDMKSHTGGIISFGRGAVMSKSAKQKLNTKLNFFSRVFKTNVFSIESCKIDFQSVSIA